MEDWESPCLTSIGKKGVVILGYAVMVWMVVIGAAWGLAHIY